MLTIYVYIAHIHLDYTVMLSLISAVCPNVFHEVFETTRGEMTAAGNTARYRHQVFELFFDLDKPCFKHVSFF